jgi:hypothetical protein
MYALKHTNGGLVTTEKVIFNTPELQVLMKEACKIIDDMGSSTPFSRLNTISRISVISKAIENIALITGTGISRSVFNGRGEMSIRRISEPDGSVEPFGKEFAQILSLVATRTGEFAVRKRVSADSTWCFLNYYEAEKIIRKLAYGEGLGNSFADKSKYQPLFC